jgi:hypothetical protein
MTTSTPAFTTVCTRYHFTDARTYELSLHTLNTHPDLAKITISNFDPDDPMRPTELLELGIQAHKFNASPAAGDWQRLAAHIADYLDDKLSIFDDVPQ